MPRFLPGRNLDIQNFSPGEIRTFRKIPISLGEKSIFAQMLEISPGEKSKHAANTHQYT